MPRAPQQKVIGSTILYSTRVHVLTAVEAHSTAPLDIAEVGDGETDIEKYYSMLYKGSIDDEDSILSPVNEQVHYQL